MPSVRSICADALSELGVLGEGEEMTATQSARALLRLQNQLDAWAANRLTLALQTRTVFTLTSGSSSVTLGPAGATVTMPRPVWIDSATYIIPASSPAVENPGGLAMLSRDEFAAISIKALSSALPQSCFYQTSTDTVLGTLTFWPVVSQNVSIVIYTPTAVGVPASLDSILTGPPGYQEAFMYQLALRLLTPMGVKVEDVPLLPGMAAEAWNVIKRVNVQPGTLGVDPALAPMGGGGYNILSDNSSGPSGR